MKKFDVEITETLQRTVSVEAVSQEEAEKIVTEAWNNEDYVLDSTDFVSVDFKTVGEQELSENRKMEINFKKSITTPAISKTQTKPSRVNLSAAISAVH